MALIPVNYDVLKNQFIRLKKELEETKQECHTLKKSAQVSEALQKDALADIEALQSAHLNEKTVYEDKIANLLEQNKNTKLEYRDKIQNLQADLVMSEKEKENLQQELESLKTNKRSVVNEDKDTKLMEEIITLKEENESLISIQDELHSKINELQKCIAVAEETISEHKDELTNLKESLSYKRDELKEQKDLVEKLNDEILFLRNELETYKSKPLDTLSKGNSLFAEVDDRRVHLQSTIDTMKSKYISMKQEVASCNIKIKHLQQENARLIQQWKIDVAERKNDDYNVESVQKQEIANLEMLVTSYKKDLEQRPFIIDNEKAFEAFESFNAMIEMKTQEVEEIKEKLAVTSRTSTLTSYNLRQVNEEKRKWRMKALELEKRINLVHEENKELNNYSSDSINNSSFLSQLNLV